VHFGEAFHNSAGALNEARAKFVEPAELDRFVGGEPLRILDVCVGLGYNTAAVLESLPTPAPAVRWWGLELDRRPLELALSQPRFQALWSKDVLHKLAAIRDQGGWSTPGDEGKQLWGDAREMLSTIPEAVRFDLILHDAFSPQRCPELWSEEFLGALAQRLAPGGRLLTYSRAAAIRGSLKRAGLKLRSLPPAPGERTGWSSGTVAFKQDTSAVGCRPLSAMEQEHLLTRAAVPFRDPDQRDLAAVILERRRREQLHCGLEATNSWQRRWRGADANGGIGSTKLSR
jgi:tRNA U34 5-methylaminomethyl-2-thiouridine-forming methyltransferase MnmC